MHQHYLLNNDSSELAPFREKMRDLLPSLGWDAKQVGEWILILDETLTNVMRHAYPEKAGQIRVNVYDSLKQTEFVVEDDGVPFDPTQMPTPKLPKETPGGLGVLFIRSLTDVFEYDSTYKKGNRLRLVRYKSCEKRS